MAANGQTKGSGCHTFVPSLSAFRPWQEISVELFEISNDGHLLMVIDYFSQWLEAIFLKKTNADAQHVRRMKAIFETYGLPEALQNDNGP